MAFLFRLASHLILILNARQYLSYGSAVNSVATAVLQCIVSRAAQGVIGRVMLWSGLDGYIVAGCCFLCAAVKGGPTFFLKFFQAHLKQFVNEYFYTSCYLPLFFETPVSVEIK